MPYTRPTTDIAREGLFNILQNNFDFHEVSSLDLFGGTGTISFELASRGVTDLTVVEKDTAMYEFIKKTAAAFQVDCNILRMDVFKYLEQCTDSFDFIFAGPPYALATIDKIPELVTGKNLLKVKGWFVLEHTPRNSYDGYPQYVTQRKYGTTVFSIFINKDE